MIDDSSGHLWLLFAAEFLIRPPTKRFLSGEVHGRAD